MYDPMKADPDSGSDLPKLQTSEGTSGFCRSGISCLTFCLAMGLGATGLGVRAIATGEVFRGNRGLDFSPWEFTGVGLFLAAFGAWGLAREIRAHLPHARRRQEKTRDSIQAGIGEP